MTIGVRTSVAHRHDQCRELLTAALQGPHVLEVQPPHGQQHPHLFLAQVQRRYLRATSLNPVSGRVRFGGS